MIIFPHVLVEQSLTMRSEGEWMCICSRLYSPPSNKRWEVSEQSLKSIWLANQYTRTVHVQDMHVGQGNTV